MEDFKKLRELNLIETKRKLRESVNADVYIVQAVAHLGDLTKVINMLTKDIREWYSWYNPEFSHDTQDHAAFISAILKGTDKKIEQGMGGAFKDTDLQPIKDVAQQVESLSELKKVQEAYIEKAMQEHCPNICAMIGGLLGARMLKQAGSLRRFAMLPSSTIQLLGAEEALFRHLKTGARPPKYGMLHSHPLVSGAKKDAGKAARLLAAKLSIASRVDFAKGKFVGDQLKKEVEDKLK